MAKKKKNELNMFHVHVGILAFSSILLAVAFLVQNLALSSAAKPADKGFDELGYNRNARIFNGPADGVDGTLDGTAYGDPTYGTDHLKMKWNAEWDRGNAENWSNGPYAAWIDNQWNGSVPGGSGENWHYKIKWIDECGSTGTPTTNGGYCIWGQFEVVMSHGTVANEHFWDTHAKPSGYKLFN